MAEESLEELRERAALMKQIADIEASAATGEVAGPADPDEVDDDAAALMRELLGEFLKQQVLQETDDPTLDVEHFNLALVLTKPMVDILEAVGWIDPCPRAWKAESTADITVAVPTPEVVRARIAQRRAAVPVESPQDPRELLLPMRVDTRYLDDDMPPELREQMLAAQAAPPVVVQDRPKKPKKPKKPKARYDGDRLDTEQRFADGSLVPPPARPALIDQEALLAWSGEQATLPVPVIPAEPAAPAEPYVRQPVKAVYPPVRNTKRKVPIQMAGLVSGQDWVRDGGGRRVPIEQKDA